MIATAISAVLVLSCGNDATETAAVDTTEANPELESRYQRLNDLHDEVMPMSAEIARTVRQLDSVAISDGDKAFAKTRLERADEAMMQWMYSHESYESAIERLGAKTAAQHFAIREREMTRIGDSMRVSIPYAKTLLAQ